MKHARLRAFWKSAKSNLYGYTALLIVLLVLWPVAAWLGWLSSTVFVSHISMAAFIVAVIACIETSRVEVKQEESDEAEEGTVESCTSDSEPSCSSSSSS